jgi:nucleoside-diphosphate-sugar epimerase
MRVFVTGASGFIGSAIVQELITAGHEVLGLARSDKAAAAVAAAGAQVHRGDLDDLESLRQGASQCDGVIHTAFNHDFSKFKDNCEADRRVIEAMGTVLQGSDRPLVVTSGTGLLPSGRLSTEADMPDPHFPRVASEQAAAALAERGVRVSVLRLPPSVHGEGDHGFVPMLIALAREKGVAAYVGEGLNHWATVHRFDAARLYRLVLEKGAGGAHYHGVAEEGVLFKDITAIIARRLNLPLVSKSAEEAAAHFGWFAHFTTIDNLASSQQTREQLGWQPTQLSLLADLDHDYYFQQ